ncbi:tRNA-dihydrouridine synthase [Tubulinosema ratisbonensis]|uniref:tRNA-dihydrouridine synthase n=1 Tax=Tubulinosema ratisbonensis TaxID=291195 RepID=A0A437AII6_9MICR|nr:tRNA-dihydrouridine synthase [Tubulinosema ratisbonensis]
METFKIYLAPMLDVTTPQFRKFIRHLNKDVILFTEMIVAETVIHVSDEKLTQILGEYEENTIVQIGGCDPYSISRAIRKINEVTKFDQFNLNCGCPSSRVQKGNFGACLMLQPETIIKIINTVYEETGFVLSLKIRIGVDEFDSYDFFKDFISSIVSNTKCDTFFVHARKCWLNGLSPSQNRTIPPIRYDFVHRIKEEFPKQKFILNGAINNVFQLQTKGNLDGFMIGRAAIKNPFIFCEFTQKLNEKYTEIEKHTTLLLNYFLLYNQNEIVKHIHIFPVLNFFHGKPGNKKYKNFITETARKKITFGDYIIKLEEFLVNFNF